MPEHKREELKLIVKIIRQKFSSSHMIILFGSYARGEWVEDIHTQGHITYEYISDFDILVLTRLKKTAQNQANQSRVDNLSERGILVIPDILCNAGGVFVSFLEYTQETQREQMTLEQVEQRLAERMKLRFNDVYDCAQKKTLTMRDAAMDMAVSKVVEAVYARGLLP